MSVLDELTIALRGEASGLVAELNKAEQHAHKTATTIAGSFESVGAEALRVTKILAGFSLAVGGVAAAIGIGLTKEAFTSADAMAKLSDRTAINIEKLYGLKVLADETGTSLESITGAITKMNRSLALASNGNIELQLAFEKLGLSVADLRKLSPEEAFGKISDALNKVDNEADRTELSMKVLGRSSAELFNVMRAGSAGIEEAANKAKELGYALNRVEAAKIEEANRALGDIRLMLEGLGNQIAQRLAPYIAGLAQAFTEAAKKAGGFGVIAENVVDGLITAIGVAGDAWRYLHLGFEAAKVAIMSMGYSFYVTLDAIAGGAVYVFNQFKNLFGIYEAEFNNIKASLELLWAGIKLAFGEMIVYVGGQFATLLEVISSNMTAAGVKGAEKFLEAANSIRGSVGSVSGSVQKGFSDAKGEAIKAGEEMKTAVGAVWKEAFTHPLADTVANAKGLWTDARADFAAVWNSPYVSPALKSWLAQIKEGHEEAAKVKAAEAPGEQKGKDKELTEAEAKQKRLLDLSKKYKLQMLASEEDGQAKQIAIWESGLKGKLEITSGILGQIATLQNSHHKSMFEVGKAAAIAQATINTYTAATGAYAAMAAIPIVGPALGIAAAAAAIAAGVVNIQNIASTSFGGGGSVSAASSPATGSGTGGASPTGSNAGGGVFPQRGQTVNLNFGGSDDDLVSQGAVRKLIKKIQLAINDGASLVVS